MAKKTTYFRQTTAQQRRLLFETWEATGNVSEACRKARVSRQTFYNWKDRFQTDGNAGLEVEKSHAPNNPQKTPADIQEQVIHLQLDNPQWGKRRIADVLCVGLVNDDSETQFSIDEHKAQTDEMGKANNWVALVSPNTVKRILRDAGLFPEPEKKKGGSKPPLAWRRNHVKP